MNGYDKPKALTIHEIELIIDTHRKFPKMTAEGIGTHVGQIMSDEYNNAHKAEIENELLPPKHYRLTDTCVSSYITAVEIISKGEPYKGCNISKVAMNEYAKKHGLPEPTYIIRPLKRKAPKQITVEELCPQEDVASQCDEKPDDTEQNMVKQEEQPQHDLAAAYRFLRDQCIEVEMNDMKHLIITMEVSKWESLF